MTDIIKQAHDIPLEIGKKRDKMIGLGWKCVDILEDFETDITTFVLIRPPSCEKHYYQKRPDGTEGFAMTCMVCH